MSKTQEPICNKCGEDYILRDGNEATELCDPCAQAELVKVRDQLREDAEFHQRLVDYVDRTLGWLHPGFHSTPELIDAANVAAKERDQLRAANAVLAEQLKKVAHLKGATALVEENTQLRRERSNLEKEVDQLCAEVEAAHRFKDFAREDVLRLHVQLEQVNAERNALRSDLKEAVECLRPFVRELATEVKRHAGDYGALRNIDTAEPDSWYGKRRSAASLLARLEEKVK